MLDPQRKARLTNQVERYRAACLQIKRIYLIDEAMDEIEPIINQLEQSVEKVEAIIKRLEFFADAATGKRTARANAMQRRSTVVPFGHPDKEAFDRLNAIQDRDQGI